MNTENLDYEEEQESEDFAALLEESMGKTSRLDIGQKAKATILQIGKEWVFLDVGQKCEGVLDVRELQNADGEVTAQVGDVIEAYFMSRAGGELRFTTRVGSGASGHAQLEEAWRGGIPVDGRVEKEIKGGYEIALPGNVRAFCPYSQIGLRRQDNPEELVGQSVSVKITQFSEQGRNIVVSRRQLLEEQRQTQAQQLRKTLKEGDRVKAEVTSLRPFGAFVDIGGIEGLLPISEVSYGRVENLEEVLQVGQQLELVVKKIDWQDNKFSFSLRDTFADPWGNVEKTFPVGSQHQGTVSRLAQFGAFVTLEEGIDGLIHISKLGEGRRIGHPREVLKEGQALDVVVEKIDLAQKRISLVPAGMEIATEQTSWNEAVSTASGLGSFGELLKASQDRKDRKKKR
ncbi:MAG: 30S ribosomal protein S1 [Desulfuromonadaceae bacterium]|nr:30S ribosomal protein S1 [Desulfuromonadaceae bacterium]